MKTWDPHEHKATTNNKINTLACVRQIAKETITFNYSNVLHVI